MLQSKRTAKKETLVSLLPGDSPSMWWERDRYEPRMLHKKKATKRLVVGAALAGLSAVLYGRHGPSRSSAVQQASPEAFIQNLQRSEEGFLTADAAAGEGLVSL